MTKINLFSVISISKVFFNISVYSPCLKSALNIKTILFVDIASYSVFRLINTQEVTDDVQWEQARKRKSLDVVSHLEKLEEPGCLATRRQAPGGRMRCGCMCAPVWAHICGTGVDSRERENTERDKVPLYNIQLEKGMLQLRKDFLMIHNGQRCNV